MRSTIAAMIAFAAFPALAQDAPNLAPTGDAAAGEAAFRQCISCHVVTNPAGETLAGRSGRTGPNLFGVAGATAGKVEEFRYSTSLSEAGEKGLIYDEAAFAAYVQDPTGFLREFLGDDRARGNMTFRLRKEEDAINLYAYLHSLAPPEAAPASN